MQMWHFWEDPDRLRPSEPQILIWKVGLIGPTLPPMKFLQGSDEMQCESPL